jgi:hypothetical protein
VAHMKKWFRRRPRREVDLTAVEQLRAEVGRLHAHRARALPPDALRAAEFQTFSQWGEDGIIQFLLGKVPIANPLFVEFGVESYVESNTRFLLVNDNWRGVIIDGGTSHLEYTTRAGLTWRHDLQVVSAFITRENINGLLASAGAIGDIGLLSVDIDGNDYWILEAIDATSPRILIVEYNAVFGGQRPVSIPYSATFARTGAHFSNLYYGASLAAITSLAERKGYRLVGCNAAGNNAFFVRQDVLGPLRALSSEEAYVESRFRESRHPDGTLSYLRTRRERLAVIGELPVIDVATGREERIDEVFAAELRPDAGGGAGQGRGVGAGAG